MSNLGLDGVLGFPATPMDERGDEVNVPAFEKLIAWMVESGVHSIISMGSTGEFAYLRENERHRIAEATVKTLKGKAPAIIGVSALTTQEAIANTRQASKVGADGVMLSIPTYYALGDREVEAHVRAVAGACDLPIILYNNPFTSRVQLTAELLDRLADVKTLVAIKDATMDVNRIPTLQVALGDRVAVLGGGFDPYALPSFCVGAKGWTTGMASLVPAKCVALHRAAVVDKNLPLAQKLDHELAPLANFLVQFGLSVAVKSGLELMGRPAGAPRRPLLPLQPKDRDRLRSILGSLGALA